MVTHTTMQMLLMSVTCMFQNEYNAVLDVGCQMSSSEERGSIVCLCDQGEPHIHGGQVLRSEVGKLRADSANSNPKATGFRPKKSQCFYSYIIRQEEFYFWRAGEALCSLLPFS